MAKRSRKTPRYQRAEAERVLDQDAVARRAARTRLEHVRDMCAAAEEARWAAVDPARRLRVVKPFGPSRQQQLDQAAINRFLEIKALVLGYTECVILEWDDDSCARMRGHLGSVACQEDADKLIMALATEFPHVRFRVELEPYVVDNVIWRSLDELPENEEVTDPRKQ